MIVQSPKSKVESPGLHSGTLAATKTKNDPRKHTKRYSLFVLVRVTSWIVFSVKELFKKQETADLFHRRSRHLAINKSRSVWFLPSTLCILLTGVCFLPPVSSVEASDPGTSDWPMWGGTPDRNMISNMKGLPTSWDVKTKKNVKWVALLGSQTYGNVVVSGGKVFVGTNNEANPSYDPSIKGDKGILMAFNEADGNFFGKWFTTNLPPAASMIGLTRAWLRRHWLKEIASTTFQIARS